MIRNYVLVKIALWMMTIGICVTLFLVFNRTWYINNFDFEELALLGDFVGGIIPAFLTISTVLIIYATYRTQQEELAATRQQLIESVEQAEITNETMKLQQFETTFFNMLDMLESTRNTLVISEDETKGKVVFNKIILEIKEVYKNEMLNDFLYSYYSKNESSFGEMWGDYYDFLYNTNAGIGNKILLKEQFTNIIKGIKSQRGDNFSLREAINFDYYYVLQGVTSGDINNNIRKILEKDYINSSDYKGKAYRTIMNKWDNPLNSYYKLIEVIYEFIGNYNGLFNIDYYEIFYSTFSDLELAVINFENEYSFSSKNDKRSRLNAFIKSRGNEVMNTIQIKYSID